MKTLEPSEFISEFSPEPEPDQVTISKSEFAELYHITREIRQLVEVGHSPFLFRNLRTSLDKLEGIDPVLYGKLS